LSASDIGVAEASCPKITPRIPKAQAKVSLVLDNVYTQSERDDAIALLKSFAQTITITDDAPNIIFKVSRTGTAPLALVAKPTSPDGATLACLTAKSLSTRVGEPVAFTPPATQVGDLPIVIDFTLNIPNDARVAPKDIGFAVASAIGGYYR
jgi:hypothetical protein